MDKPISYLQWDSEWKSVAYTSTGDSSQTIGSSGCGPTSAAMVIATLRDEDVTPVDTCEWAVNNDYRTANQGTSFSYFVPQLAKYDIDATYTWSVSAATEALKAGYMVIGRATSGLWTSSGHYILGYYTDGDTVYVNDPNSTKTSKTEAALSTWESQVAPFWIINEDWHNTESEDDEDMDLDGFKELLTEYRAELQDNDSSDYSEAAREWAVDNGLIKGSTDDDDENFMWEDFLTREQEITILYRFATEVLGL